MSGVHLSPHVRDAARGRPAAGVPVRWEAQGAGGAWAPVGEAITDGDGRVAADAWARTGTSGDATSGDPTSGRHRLVFDVEAWSAEADVDCFFPEVTITFRVGAEARYHVPLLLSPFAYSTYRGS